MLHSSIFRLKTIRFVAGLLLAASAWLCQAASIRGVVTDTTGARVKGAVVTLVASGQPVASAVSTADGSFEVLTGTEGRFFLLVSANSFRQLETPDFYAGRLDSVEKTLVLEPEWARQSIVVTANGVPTPQGQTSETTSVLDAQALESRSDLTSALRLMPGTFVVQNGQMGSAASLFVRGGNSSANKVMIDGVDAGDLGGAFDFGPLSTTAIESAEVYRGANSSLYGADAGSSVISLRTPHGTTSFPSLLLRADGGNLKTTRDELTLAGARHRLDYLGSFSWLQTANDLPNDSYHSGTTAANLGWQPNAATQLRGTVHYGVSGGGQPNAWEFYQIADNVTQKDQDLIVSGSIDHQTTAALHNVLRYGATRKRLQYTQWSQEGLPDSWGDALGKVVTINGANGTSVTGQAILDYYGAYPSGFEGVSNRDQLSYQGDYRFTPHLMGLIGYHYADERGVYRSPSWGIDNVVGRNDSVYLAAIHGDFHNRFFYNLGGSLEHNSLFGTVTTPRAGASYILIKPHGKVFSGTRLHFNYGDGVREPTLSNEATSLYKLLGAASAKQYGISPITAPTTRSYESGLTQSFFEERLLVRLNYFHNQFGREIESVSGKQLKTMIPGLIVSNYTSYAMNTEAFRAQGVEATVEGGIGSRIFLRGGYTYTDAVVQRSYSSDNVALMGGTPTTYKGIALGWWSPLKGARPFRRPPHTGFFTATYGGKKMTGFVSASMASRSDDSTFLFDSYYGSSLTLPNRNLDPGYAKIDVGSTYQLRSWLGVYTYLENLTNNQHIAPIGYRSLPVTVRTGVKIDLGRMR